jgi:hypothetical protein
MAEETTDVNQTLQTGEGESQETESSPTGSAVDVETLAERNRQLYARATKAETKLKQYEKTDKTEVKQTESSQIPNDRLERLELRTEGYSGEEIEAIMELGGRNSLQNPVVVKAIEVMRKEAKSKNATPSGTAKSPVYQKYTEQDLKKMPIEEFEKLLQE